MASRTFQLFNPAQKILSIPYRTKTISAAVPAIQPPSTPAQAKILSIAATKMQLQSIPDIVNKPVVIGKRARKFLIKSYPTLLQFSDGSTIMIPYHEPIGIIKLPLDLRTLTEEQKKERLLKRIPKSKIKIQEDIDDDFDETRYLDLTKKKK